MKITLCHSVTFMKEAKEIEKRLTKMGHKVFAVPYSEKSPQELEKMISDRENYINVIKPKCIKEHFDNIMKSDAILVINLDKNGKKNYIGGSVFSEIMFAFYKNKKIFLWNPVPEVMFRDEIEAVKPIVINGNLEMIK
jgi:hypothetical protein